LPRRGLGARYVIRQQTLAVSGISAYETEGSG